MKIKQKIKIEGTKALQQFVLQSCAPKTKKATIVAVTSQQSEQVKLQKRNKTNRKKKEKNIEVKQKALFVQQMLVKIAIAPLVVG